MRDQAQQTVNNRTYIHLRGKGFPNAFLAISGHALSAIHLTMTPLHTGISEIQPLADATNTLITIMGYARELLGAEQTVDLTGLDQQVGLVCAKILDLPAEQGQKMRPSLVLLLSVADSVLQILMPPEAQSTP